MRAHHSIVLALVASGCAISAHESRGVTRTQLAGTASLVFTNATPDTMCSLRIEQDGSKTFGDNWLPAAGLPTGKSIDLQVKPGTYMATWNTCRKPQQRYFAATLTSETSFTIRDARDSKQLFAYVADTVAPTSRAAPRAYHAMVKFQGQAIEALGAKTAPVVVYAATQADPSLRAELLRAEPEPRRFEPEPKHVDLSEFIDRKAVAALMAKRAKTPPAKVRPMRASLARKHDLADRQVGYAERNR